VFQKNAIRQESRDKSYLSRTASTVPPSAPRRGNQRPPELIQKFANLACGSASKTSGTAGDLRTTSAEGMAFDG
jgi:hypothetical protein